jgi:hypothetical protein
VVNVQNCLSDCWFRLGFQNAGDMATSPWLATTEPYQFADDALKRLARMTGAFMTYDSSIAITAPTNVYAQPAGWVLTASAWLVGGSQLRITPVATLFALDQAWNTTYGAPARVSFDAAGAGNAVLYPVPNINGTLGQVMAVLPPTVTSGAPSIALSPVAQDYFTYAMIAGARGKESDSAMPEVAEHMYERMQAYEKIFTQLWGEGR